MNLNIFVVLFGSLIASIFVYFFANLIGKPSQKYGLTFSSNFKNLIGIKGAKYFALLRGLLEFLCLEFKHIFYQNFLVT